MRIIGDMHTHTLASQHAYSTILENVRYAAGAGMLYLGWTDHAPKMVDGAHSWHFGNLHAVPERLEGVRILKGAEADIIGYQGDLDMDNGSLRHLDWVAASIHSPLLAKASMEEITAAYIGAAMNPYVDVIAHSGYQDYPYDYEKAVQVFRDQGKLLEINEHSYEARSGSIPNCITLAKLCKQYGCRIVVDSDAHFATQIGQFENALKMLAEIDFPEELVVNASVENMEAYLTERKARISSL